MPAEYDPEQLQEKEQEESPIDDGQMSLADEKAGKDFENQVGRGYRPDNPNRLSKIKPSVGGVFSFARANRGKVVIGGAALSFVTLIVVGFLILLPFKILHIVNNLQSRFYATSENAVQKETDVLFSQYIKKYVIPGLNTCKGSTIDINCTPKEIQGNSIVSKLYQGWKTSRFENKIATKYGLEFKKVGTNFYMKMPGMTGDGAKIDDFADPNQTQLFSLDDYTQNSKDPQFQKVGRAELRRTYREALANETKWKRVMYRFKIGGYLDRKFGVKRCIIACNTRDNFADWKDHKTRAAKMIIAERVLAPRSETLALVIQCVLDSTCDPTKRDQTDDNGRKQSKIQQDMQAKLAELKLVDTGKYTAVLSHSEGILTDGYKKYILKRIVKSLFGDATAVVSEKVTSSLVPVVGWVNTAASTIGMVDGAPGKIKALSYLTNATAMVSLYTTYRTYADETKTGNVDAAMVGSFTSALGPGDASSTGGSAGAEATPLYGSLISGNNQTSGPVFSNLFGGKAYAASNPTKYVCKDGKPVTAGKLVCQEEVLGGDNGVTGSINVLRSNLGPLRSLAGFWNSTVGYPFRAVAKFTTYIADGILTNLPSYGALVNKVGEAAAPIINNFTNDIIPSPFSDNMGGGRTFDMMAGGADVSGNDYAQNGLGGKKLSDQQAAVILSEQQQQDLQQYQHKSFFARLLDTNSNYSPAAKLAVAMPSNLQSAKISLANFFTNPQAKLLNIFSSMFNVSHAQAATAAADPFGVTQYGFPANDSNLAAANQDSESYFANNCTSDGTNIDWEKPVNKAWQDSATVNSDTGMPENTTTNPCLLIQAAVGSSGALYDDNLLTQDDLAGSNTDSSTSNSSPTNGGGISIDNEAAKQVAQQAGGKVGYTLFDSSGQVLANYNDDFENYGASITKSMLLVAYLKQVGSAALSPQESSKLTNMIENSDNNSANWIYLHLKNRTSAVNAVASNAGMTGFKLDDKSDSVYLLGQSKITARDFAKFFAKIDQLMPVSQRNFGLNLLSHIAHQAGLLKAGLPGTVYSKEGWKPEAAGLLGAPYVVNQAGQFSAGGQTYGIAVTVGGTSDQASGESIVQKVVSALIKSQ